MLEPQKILDEIWLCYKKLINEGKENIVIYLGREEIIAVQEELYWFRTDEVVKIEKGFINSIYNLPVIYVMEKSHFNVAKQALEKGDAQ